MPIRWSKTLATGIPWQDAQHRQLFERTGSLLDAISLGVGKEEVLRLFSFLDDYFVDHFHKEEEEMHRYNYPDTLRHLKEHTGFIEDMSRLRDEALEKGVTQGLLIQVQRRVVDWLSNHIGSVDKELAEFILKAGGKKG